jgi:hypothetical protein
VHSFLRAQPPDEQYRLRAPGIGAGLQEALIDSVVERMAAAGDRRKAPGDGIDHEVAAAKDERRLLQPRAHHRRIEVGQRMIVHVKHDMRLRIEGAHDRNEAGHAVDVNQMALPRADVQRHAARIVCVVERAQPERTFRLEHALIENFEQVDGRVPPLGHAPMSHSLMTLDFTLAPAAFRVGDDAMRACEAPPQLVVDYRQRVEDFRVRYGDDGMRINLRNVHGH